MHYTTVTLTVLYSTALQYITLQWHSQCSTALPCNTLHCSDIHNALHLCLAIHYTTVKFTVLYSNALQYITLQWHSQCLTTMPCNTLHYIDIHSALLHCNVLHLAHPLRWQLPHFSNKSQNNDHPTILKICTKRTRNLWGGAFLLLIPFIATLYCFVSFYRLDCFMELRFIAKFLNIREISKVQSESKNKFTILL